MVRRVTSQYNRTGVEKNVMYWWTGQVVDESTWLDNELTPNHPKGAAKGHGKRYRVRIFSRDSEVKIVPDQQLDMADVIIPVTAGSGHGCYSETVVLSQGSWVTGWFWDGAEGRQPVILGSLPNNPDTGLFGGDPPEGYIGRTGLNGLTGPKPIKEEDILAGTASGTAMPAIESKSADPSELTNADPIQTADGNEVSPRKRNIECEGGSGPLKGVQGFIQRALATIQKLKLFKSTAQSTINSILATASNITNQVAGAVASLFKMIVGKMRGFILNKINAGLKDVGELLPPSLRQAFSSGANNTIDTLACVFQKIMGTLFQMAKGMFEELVDSYVMAPLCAAEKMVGDMIGNILGEITDAVDGAIGAIAGLVDSGFAIVDQAFSVLEIIQGLLNFLKCDATPDCEYKDQWSFWNGSSLSADVSDGIANIMKDISQGVDNALGGGGEGGGGAGAGCNTDQLPCGPPGLSFSGGGGSGLAGNLIMSAGQIMGVDFSSFGSGYSYTPTLSVTDGCGNGGGYKIELLTNDGNNSSSDTSIKEGENIQIVGAVVVQPGSGYLDEPDGSTNISKPEESIIRYEDDRWEVMKPDDVVEIPYKEDGYDNCPTIAMPVDTESQVFDPSGNVIQVLTGQGPTTPLPMCNGGTITIPTPPNVFENEQGPADFTGTAPVDPELNSPYVNVTTGTGNWDGFVGEDVRNDDKAIWDGEKWRLIKEPRDNRPNSGGEKADIILDGVYIYNPGYNYQQGDVIVVEPDTGLKLIPTFNDIGQLTDVTIQDPGSTFSSYPEIYIKSVTGINATILPIFKVRTEEDPDANSRILSGDRIISVDDCIGRLIIGYVNGQPYYGPFHKHKGRKMVGAVHSSKPHAFIYDTPEASLRDPYSKLKSKIYTAGPTVPVEETEVSSDESVMVEQSTPTPAPTQTPTIISTPTPPPTTRPTPPPSSGGSSGYSSGGSGGSGY